MGIFFIIVLIATSVVAVTFIVERGLALRWEKTIPPAVSQAVGSFQTARDLPMLRGTCEQNPSPTSRLLIFAAEHLDWPREENVDVLETRARQEVGQLERGLVVLEIIVGIAPLIGLMGTIFGLIRIFKSMGVETGVDQAQFAMGISEALWFTFGGLFIAIPALAAWSYYSKKVENLAMEMESLCDEFLRKHYRTEAYDNLRLPAPPRIG